MAFSDVLRWVVAPRASAADYFAQQNAERIAGLLGTAPMDQPGQMGGEGFVPGSGLLANPLDPRNVAQFAAQASAVPGYQQAGMGLLGSLSNQYEQLNLKRQQFSDEMAEARRKFGLEHDLAERIGVADILAKGRTAKAQGRDKFLKEFKTGQDIGERFGKDTRAMDQRAEYAELASQVLNRAGGWHKVDAIGSETLITAFLKVIRPNEAVMSEENARVIATRTLREDVETLRKRLSGGGTLSKDQVKAIWATIEGLTQSDRDERERRRAIEIQNLSIAGLPAEMFPAQLNPANWRQVTAPGWIGQPQLPGATARSGAIGNTAAPAEDGISWGNWFGGP